jgi:hypothetical protein
LTHVHVLVRLGAAVVETRVLALAEDLRLGEAAGCAVGFPGGTLRVHRDGSGQWSVGGRPLRLGRPVDFRFGDVSVQIDAVAIGPEHVGRDALPDPRLVVGALATLLIVLSLDALGRVIDDRPDLAAGLQALVVPPADPPADPPVVAPPSVPTVAITPGVVATR